MAEVRAPGYQRVRLLRRSCPRVRHYSARYPHAWLNYIGEGRYGGIVSNTGGGYSFDCDPRNRRVTRYRYNSVPDDQPGRYIYLRDQETGEYWSPRRGRRTWSWTATSAAWRCLHPDRRHVQGHRGGGHVLRAAQSGRRARSMRAVDPQGRNTGTAPRACGRSRTRSSASATP